MRWKDIDFLLGVVHHSRLLLTIRLRLIAKTLSFAAAVMKKDVS